MIASTVSIAIATLNRRDDLQETLQEIEKLDPYPDEILVCLDGCTDGSREMLRAFPTVKVIEHDRPHGSVASRDELFRLANGDLIVSLDDDSFPTQSDFVSRLLGLANSHPEAGVFVFEEIRPKGRDDRLFSTPNGAAYVASYPNCAGAVRSSLYGDKASYPIIFFHMYEEPDFCLQAYANGYGVLYVPSLQVMHRYTHVGRNMIKRHHQHARNELLSVIMRCPMPQVFGMASYRVLRQFIYAGSNGINWLLREPVWWWQALCAAPRALKLRKPIPWSIYWAWVRLARQPIQSVEEITARFPNIGLRK